MKTMKILMMICFTMILLGLLSSFAVAQNVLLDCNAETSRIEDPSLRAVRIYQCQAHNESLRRWDYGGMIVSGGVQLRPQQPISGANVATSDELKNLIAHEIAREFFQKGYVVIEDEKVAEFVCEVEIFYPSNYQSIVYLKVKHQESGVIASLGRGQGSAVRQAAERAAKDATKKMREKYKTVFIDLS